MISVKKYAEARIEITLQVLIGELPRLERDFYRLPLAKVLDMWGPETKRQDMYLHIQALDEIREEKLTRTGKVRKSRKKKEPKSEIERGDSSGDRSAQTPTR